MFAKSGSSAAKRWRLFGSGAAEARLGEVVRNAQSRRLLSSDRLVVDGTLVKTWARLPRPQPQSRLRTPVKRRGRLLVDHLGVAVDKADRRGAGVAEVEREVLAFVDHHGERRIGDALHGLAEQA